MSAGYAGGRGTYVALLRGVNVSGQRAVPMAKLREALAAIGLLDVRTYLQSGNVVFRAANGSPEALSGAIHATIEREFGHDVDVLVLRADEFARIAGSNALLAEQDVDAAMLHVTFLFGPKDAGRIAGLTPPAAAGERVEPGDGVLYLYLPHGYGRTKLSGAYFERALQTRTTTRNWRTVTALAEMAAAR